LRRKSDVLVTFVSFQAFVQAQFQCLIACLQTDNRKEFDNHALRSFLVVPDMVLRLTCPYPSQQNSRVERVLLTLNESMRTMLLHASAPLSFWPDVLTIAMYLLNRRPCGTCHNQTPYQLLFIVPLEYSLLEPDRRTHYPFYIT
jgi:hypothetical protein